MDENRFSTSTETKSQSYQTFFRCKNIIFLVFFAVKLGYFIVNTSFSFVTSFQALHQKLENEEKKSLDWLQVKIGIGPHKSALNIQKARQFVAMIENDLAFLERMI